MKNIVRIVDIVCKTLTRLVQTELQVILLQDGEKVRLVLAVHGDVLRMRTVTAVWKLELEWETGKRDILQVLPQTITDN